MEIKRGGKYRIKGKSEYFKDKYGTSNPIIVIEDTDNRNTYEGCYTGFPQYGVAVDVRTGDFLAMDVHQWHCNTEFVDLDGDDTPTVVSPRTGKPVLREWQYNRLSIVCYLRDNMINCRTSQPTRDEITRLRQEYQMRYSNR